MRIELRILLDDDEIPLEELLSAILGSEGDITPDEPVQPDKPVVDEPTTKVEVVEPVEEPTEIEEPEVIEQVEEPLTVRARSPWTDEDESTLLRLHDDEGMDWGEISETMGRTTVACRVRYNLLTKAIREAAEEPETVEVKPESKPKKTKAEPLKRARRSRKKPSGVSDYGIENIDSLGAKEVKAMREQGIDTLDHFAAAEDVTLFNLMLGRRTNQRLTAARRQCVALLRKRNAERLDAEQQQLEQMPKKEPVPFVVEKNEDEVYMREAWDAIQQMRQDRKGSGVFVGDYVVLLAKERILRRYSCIEGDESVFDKELDSATNEMVVCVNACFETGSLMSKHMGHVADLVILDPKVEWPALAQVLDKRVP